MPTRPSKYLPFYLSGVLIFWAASGFCAQKELLEFKKQARIYRLQGCELQKQNRIEEAFSYYQKALLVDPGYVAAYNDIGIIFEAQSRKEEAKEMYLKAIEINAGYPNSYSNLALLYENSGDYSNAILYWKKRIDLKGGRGLWRKIARNRLKELSRLYPEVYHKVTGN